MKTSTKIFLVYGSILIALQLIFLVNSVVQYQRLKTEGKEMCAALDQTAIHHIEVDVSDAAYSPSSRSREGGPWIEKSKNHRSFYFGANLETSRISNDTLYIKAWKDDLSWRPSEIPELRSSTIITPEGVVNKEY